MTSNLTKAVIEKCMFEAIFGTFAWGGWMKSESFFIFLPATAVSLVLRYNRLTLDCKMVEDVQS